MNKKYRKGYRFSDTTIRQLDWLTQHLNTDESEVVRSAIAEMYQREWKSRNAAQLIEQGDHFALVGQGKTLVRLSREGVNALPDDMKAALLSGELTIGEAITRLILGAARVGESIVVDESLAAGLGF